MTKASPVSLDPAAVKAAGERVRLRQAAEAFEALMVKTLLKSMSKAQLENGFFGDGPGASTYQEIFEEQFAERIAEGSPFGIARMLEEQLAERVDPAREVSEALNKAAEAQAREAYGAAAEAGGGRLPSAPPRPKAPSPAPSAPVQPSHDRSGKMDIRHTFPSVSSSFGWRRDPFDGSPRWHEGVDLPAPVGTPVLAVAPGEVVSVTRGGGYGLEVVVRHDLGWTTRYAHLSGAEVREGQKVGRGTLLGEVGSTGRSTGPHLHFEAAREGQKVDPAVAAPGSLRAQVLRGQADEN